MPEQQQHTSTRQQSISEDHKLRWRVQTRDPRQHLLMMTSTADKSAYHHQQTLVSRSKPPACCKIQTNPATHRQLRRYHVMQKLPFQKRQHFLTHSQAAASITSSSSALRTTH
jgi:hypothetical protein